MINQEKSILKRILPHIGAIVFFLLITLVYFSPTLDGKVLQQTDVTQYNGMSQELRSYYNDEGVASAWTGSAFSGMPSYQIGVWGTLPNLLNYVEKPLRILDDNSAAPVFAGMVMAYLLFVLMGFGVIPSMIGAIAYSFSSYNIIILEAGHITKAWTLVYLPLIVAGLITIMKKKYFAGGLIMALALSLQIKNNHLQVTYYTGLLCAFIYIGYAIKTIMSKDFKSLLKASGVLTLVVVLSVLANAYSFYSNYEMSRESIRGQSELSQLTETEKQSSGLDKEYAFNWSYGKSETLSLLIPNINGGASGGTLDTSSELYKQFKANGQQVGSEGIQGMPTYWGDQPWTSGPVYFGAIICFLFLLGMIIVKSRMKWVLLTATVFFVFLAWGKNFETFNDWFFYHFPLYNKFRAVTMALVIPALTMLMIAVWAVKEFFAMEDIKKKQKALYISAGITGGLCLFFWLLPDFFFNFTSDLDAGIRAQVPDWFYNALLQDRKSLLTSDAFRSFVFIFLSAFALWSTTKIKADRQKLALGCGIVLLVLVLVDLWNVDKRYVNEKSFHNKVNYTAQAFRKTNADNFILQDKSPSYRVLNLNNPFQDASTSYYHKSIGGYHAAKLKRYQELIEYHIQPQITRFVQSFQSQDLDFIISEMAPLSALNMLNAKYIIYNPEQQPLVNPFALGNAWFVNNYRFVDNADDEIAALGTINPAETAIVDKRFENELTGFNIVPDSTASITMTLYKPDRVKYTSKTTGEQLAVFSEIYYDKGWEAYIDGKFVPHFRVDWTLRALRVPSGEHEIEFKFIPHGYYASVTVSKISSGLLIVLLVMGIIFYVRNTLVAKGKE